MDENMWEKSCVIYKITNLIDGKVYVGQTRQKLKKRISHHKKHNPHYLGHAIKKHGWENFKVEILEECETPEKLNERETFWIKKLNCQSPNGYNLTNGGDGLSGHPHTEKTRAKMSNNHPGKCSVRCSNNGMIFNSMHEAANYFGIVGASVSAVCNGRCLTINGLSFEYCDEEKRAAAEIKRQKLSPMKKPVRCIETGIVYESSVAASKATGVYRRSIAFACSGKHKTAGGYHWEFVNPEDANKN